MATENPYAKYRPAPTPAPTRQATIFQDPYAAPAERRREEDQDFERQRIEIARRASDLAAQAGARADDIAALNAPKIQADTIVAQAKAEEALRKQQNASQADLERLAQIDTMLESLDRVERLAGDSFAVGNYSDWARDIPVIGPWLGQSRSDIDGALQMLEGDMIQQQIARLAQVNQGGVATMANSQEEARRLAASIANLDPTQSYEEFMVGVQRARDYYNRQRAAEVAKGLPNATTQNRFVDGAGVGAAGFGATTASDPIPPEMQAEYEAGLPGVMVNGRIDPQAYAAFRDELDRKYGYPANTQSYLDWADATNARLEQGGAAISTQIPAPERELSGVEQMRNNAVSNPFGAGAAGFANAAGFGIPSAMAGDQYDAMREANPVSSFIGELAGSGLGVLTGGALLGAAGRRIANPTVAEILANPLTADATYGAVYGATQADDPLYGAVGGGVAAVVGNRLGGIIGRNAPRLTGVGRAEDTLGRGERAVFNAAGDRDDVIAQLARAEGLNVPASIADVSSGVESLTGSAIRRSPEAGGVARDILGRRSRGQYDRYLGAIEDNLGTIANIPQRSEDLLQQARTAARPLYEEAYAAPGASSVDIADLINRPTFRDALRQAYAEVADEGLDPTALGFDLNDAGEVVLTRTPSWQTLDYVKRGLDNVIEAGTDTINGVNAAGRRATSMKNDLLGRMDAKNPAYKQARAAYAGPAAERALLRQGQKAGNVSPNQLGVDVDGMSPNQMGQVQLGFQSQLAENAGRLRGSSNPFGQLDTPGMEQRINALYDPENVSSLLARGEMERNLASSTNRMIGNSMTAERLLADQAFSQNSLLGDAAQGAIETAITGAPVVTAARSAAGRGLGNMFRDYRQLGLGRNATALADEIVPLALNTNPRASIDILEELAQRDAAYQQIVDELTRKAGIRGGHAGAALGSTVAGALSR